MRFLVFLDQASAVAAVEQINGNGRALFAARGYGVDENGDVEARRLSDGSIVHEAKTQTWDVPRQRLDGKWIISHPENAMRADTVVDEQGATGAEVVMVDVVFEAIEAFDDAWFPAPEGGP